MTLRKPKIDEWGVILEKQLELNKIHEIDEKARQAHEKEFLRRELDYQQSLKEAQKRQKLNLIAKDYEDVQERTNWFRRQDLIKREQERMQKSEIAENLLNHHSFIKQREAEERKQKYLEELEQAKIARQNIEIDEQRKIAQKIQLNREQQMIRQLQEEQAKERKQIDMNEKQREMELIMQRKERDDKREREYKQHYQHIYEDQLNKAIRFSSVIAKEMQKDSQIDNWIEKGVENYQQKLAEKEAYEREVKERNAKAVKDMLRNQIEQKESQKRKEMEEYRKEQEELNKRVEFSRMLEEERERQKFMQKQDYVDQLLRQTKAEEDSKAYTFKLSDHEKLLNKNLLDEAILSRRFKRGADEIVKGRSPSQSLEETNPRKILAYEYNAPIIGETQSLRHRGNNYKRINPITGIEYGYELPKSSLNNSLLW
ncbi:unnamed protein product [Blepharisma stoltei]|uniref:Trichohyalin-plectin-homology domain-containing protein n=1 Tax=Blepharisma stoltei TaxID=1481888 RepID=A0AAU9K8T2_9CILI|nr:unnamed protein product [Blepharisma stoltei]